MPVRLSCLILQSLFASLSYPPSLCVIYSVLMFSDFDSLEGLVVSSQKNDVCICRHLKKTSKTSVNVDQLRLSQHIINLVSSPQLLTRNAFLKVLNLETRFTDHRGRWQSSCDAPRANRKPQAVANFPNQWRNLSGLLWMRQTEGSSNHLPRYFFKPSLSKHFLWGPMKCSILCVSLVAL